MALKKTFTMTNRLGLHARPAAHFVKTACRYESDIMVSKDGEEVNGKSILGLMMLAAEYGSEVEIAVSGSDEVEAMAEIESLAANGFPSS